MLSVRLHLAQFVILFILSTGCSEFETIRPVEDDGQAYRLSVGDRVEVITADVKVYRFKITDITETALIGGDESVPFKEIRLVKRESIDEERAHAIKALSVLYTITAAGFVLIAQMPPPIPPP